MYVCVSDSWITISAFCRLTLCLGAIVLSRELFHVEGCWWAGVAIVQGVSSLPHVAVNMFVSA